MRVNGQRKEILRRIKADPYWLEVVTLVQRNVSGKFYLVGGKLYRTALEVCYGIDAGSVKADWDFLALKVEPQYVSLTNGWRFARFPIRDEEEAYPEEMTVRSARLEKRQTRNVVAGIVVPSLFGRLKVLTKLDIIDVRDTQNYRKPLNDISGYFDAVPISIQAIAYDFHKDEIIGDRGIWSIMNRTIFVNPTFDIRRENYRSPSQWRDYFNKKEQTTGCKLKSGKHTCYCYPENHAMLSWGCKCGGK